jgi:hypothetical protein
MVRRLPLHGSMPRCLVVGILIGQWLAFGNSFLTRWDVSVDPDHRPRQPAAAVYASPS